MRSMVQSFLCIVILAGATQLYGAEAKVIKADDNMVQIGMGLDREVKEGMIADVYRQAVPIIHPVTGENLGSPSVKIARIEIWKVEPTTATGRYLSRYAPVQMGDLVIGLEVAPSAEEKVRAEVKEARDEIKALARSLADEIKANQKSINDLRGTLRRVSSSERRLQTLINAVQNMRERMVTLESRVVSLEEQEQEWIHRDTSEVKEGSAADMNELRILRPGGEEEAALQRSGDEVLYLKLGDQMYRVSLEQNLLIEESAMQTAAAGAEESETEQGDLLGDDLFEEPEAEVPWYKTYWWLILIGPAGAVILLVLKMMRRPKEEASEEGEEGEEGFAEAEEMDEIPEAIPEPEEVEAAGGEK